MKKYSLLEIESMYHEYQNTYPVLEEVATKAIEVFSTLLNSLDISLSQPLQYRIKSWESTKEKLERGEVNIKKLIELQDLIGFRVIMLFTRDVDIVGDAISKSFHVIKNYDTKERLGVEKFGYISKHYIIGLDADDLGIEENLISNFVIEIQVRTLAQHLWAEVSHLLSYKREESVSPPILRELNSTAALLENVDKSFERVLNEREKYRKGIVDLETDKSLDVDILQVTLDALWPLENKLEKEPYEYLLYTLEKNDINTQKKLTNLIRKHYTDVIKRSAREAERLRNLIITHPPENGVIKTISPNKVHIRSGITQELINKVEKGVHYGHVALTITAVQFETGERNPSDPLD
jgi:ppGpp synthetase/RelA/SpoT-type nucleotidyltranferase